ncbi:MAG: YebC/PmpR family DNA-binding transcriptional regulator, partial [Sulfurovum sp.]|nr:YebC/PmpR family DNA-binding transcriptional regulator [Sulfurovum sp.]
ELIDAGLEEIEEAIEPQEEGEDKAIIKIFAEFEAFGDLNKALEEMNIEVKSAKHERIANTPIDLTDEQMEEVEVLIDKLEDDEDVQAVYTNIN